MCFELFFRLWLWQSGTAPRRTYIDREEDAESLLGEFEARKYDDGIGRFTSIDPWWEKFRSQTPYNYGENNPVRLKDPNGKGPLTEGAKKIARHPIIRRIAPKLGARITRFENFLDNTIRDPGRISTFFQRWMSGTDKVLFQGISGRGYSLEIIKKLFQSKAGGTTTLYRAVTGSEGKGSLFVTNSLEYAKTYLKDAKEGVIQTYKVSNDALKTLTTEGVIRTMQGSNSSGVSGLEYYIQHPVVVKEILNSAAEQIKIIP